MTTAIRLMPLLLFPVQPPGYGLDCPAHLVNPTRRPPARCHIPAHLTNYWPFADGQLMDGYNGQCDSDCSVTATGVPTVEAVGWVAACPTALIGETVDLGVYGVWACNDAFGDPDYAAGPFYHEGRGLWVMPFDLLTAAPTYELLWGWEVRP